MGIAIPFLYDAEFKTFICNAIVELNYTAHKLRFAPVRYFPVCYYNNVYVAFFRIETTHCIRPVQVNADKSVIKTVARALHKFVK